MSGQYFAAAGLSARGRHVAIVATRFNEPIVNVLLEGAIGAWRERGGAEEHLTIVRVPGAFELPLAVRKLACSGRYEAVVALGCVIRGDTPHFDYVAGECARGLQDAALHSGVPVAFGVLTVNTLEQAQARAGGAMGNKGAEALDTVLEMIELFAQLDRKSH